MPDIRVPDDVLQAAAERANQEQRSVTDVIAALMRDYARGRTWLNLPDGEQLLCPGATGPSSIGYVPGAAKCQPYPGCYRGILALPGRDPDWACCHTHAEEAAAIACARSSARELSRALADDSPPLGQDQSEVHWAPYREFGTPDPAEQSHEPPAGLVIICATGYQREQGAERIVIYWSRDGRRSTSAGQE
jgi:hypothetical protein